MLSGMRGWWLAVTVLIGLGQAPTAAATQTAGQAQALAVPVRFEPNRGQTDSRVRYVARGIGYGLFITDAETVLRFGTPGQPATVLRMALAGATLERPRARHRQSGRSHYLTLDGSSAPVRDVPQFSQVVRHAAYAGVDVVYYGNDAQLEYDFVVAPDADPGLIALAFTGAEEISIAENGDLHIDLGERTLVQRAPVAYQDAVANASRRAPARSPVSARYRIDANGQVGFELGDYDRGRTLVIDPVITYGSYLGGSGYDGIRDIARGSDGSLYLTGFTYSLDFPTLNPIHGNLGGKEGFITKLDPTGSNLVFSTYVGGLGNQQGNAIEVDPQARPVICGFNEMPNQSMNAFVLRLTATGTLSWTRTISTQNVDECLDLALDGEQPIGIGYTFSDTDFPRVNALANWNIAGGDAPFLVRYDTNGTLIQSTLLPNDANSNDGANGIAVKDGYAYVTGIWSPNGNQANRQAFVIKLDADASFPESGEYLRSFGGTTSDPANPLYGAYDVGSAIAVDASGRAFVTGTTYTTDFPVTVDAFQSTYNGGGDAFLVRLATNGSVAFASYLHSAIFPGGNEIPARVVFDAANTLYVVGDLSGAFIARLPNFATQLDYLQPIRSFYLDAGRATGIVMAGTATPIIAGEDAGERFPTTPGALQTTSTGGDGYLLRFEERLPVISIQPASVQENAGCVDLTVRTDVSSTLDVRFNWSTQNGTAIAGSDYQSGSGNNIGISPGSTVPNVNVSVCVTNDTLDEADETLTVNLTGVTGATVGSGSATITLIDDDASPSIAVDNGGCSVTEGNSGASDCNFVVRLSAVSSRAVTFNSVTANGTANAGIDFTGHNATARTIAAGQTTLTIAVPVLGDALDEPDESFGLTITNVVNATPGNLSATGTIVDDDPTPTLAVDSGGCSVVEGNSGSSNCPFVVRMSALSARTVSFNSATVAGSASAGSDYTAHAATARTIPSGQLTLTIAVPILGDSVPEADESFALQLSAVVNAAPTTFSGTGTIQNDDAATLSINDASVVEGDSGTRVATVMLSLSPASAQAVSVSYATTNAGSVNGNGGFEAPLVGGSGVSSFSSGQSFDSWIVSSGSVDVVGTALWNAAYGNQSLDLNGAAPGAIHQDIAVTPGQSYGLSFLLAGNPGCAGVPVKTLEVSWGGNVVGLYDFDTTGHTAPNLGFGMHQLTVVAAAASQRLSLRSLNAGACGPVLDGVQVKPAGAATGSGDFASAGGVVSFAAGETMKPLSLTVNGDYAIEPDEQAFIDLSAPVNAILADSRGVITITNDDSAGTLALASGAISLSEGATATTIQIQRSGGQGQDVGATFATVAGTAIAGADYTALSRRLRFAGGQSAQTVDIALLPDALDEDDESFSAGLAGAFGGAAIGNPGTIVMTIQDNDPTPSLSIDNGGCTLIEGNSGTQNCAFVLRLSALSGRAVGLTTTTTGVSASGVVDFTAHTQVVRTLNAGLPTLSVLVPVIGDTAVEPTESFTLDVSATVNATPTSLLGVGTIVNDDGDGLLSNGFE